jgi:hypothetical protein
MASLQADAYLAVLVRVQYDRFNIPVNNKFTCFSTGYRIYYGRMEVRTQYEQCSGIWVSRILGSRGVLAVMTFDSQPSAEEVLRDYDIAERTVMVSDSAIAA